MHNFEEHVRINPSSYAQLAGKVKNLLHYVYLIGSYNVQGTKNMQIPILAVGSEWDK